MVRSVGVFNQFHDDGGFWPTDRPIMSGLLAVLTLLGLGWVCPRWRDPRYVLLAIWFWVGFSGVIVTVETPNVQRMATACRCWPCCPRWCSTAWSGGRPARLVRGRQPIPARTALSAARVCKLAGGGRRWRW